MSSDHIITLAHSCVAGYENLVVWADLLDRINVFPVADGDTGSNLRISLSPLRNSVVDMEGSVKRLLSSGLGNSGNIAVAFLEKFLDIDGDYLAIQAEKGREQAFLAIQTPTSGTMLDVFDALSSILKDEQDERIRFPVIRNVLQEAVTGTVNRLPELKDACVVDSGALGMFLFFDGFFQQHILKEKSSTPVIELFGTRLQISSSYRPQTTEEYCVDALLDVDMQKAELADQISALGKSVVVVPGSSETKVHIHTENPVRLRKELSALGDIVNWSDEAIDTVQLRQDENLFRNNTIRVTTDAAGSIPLSLAREYGIILFDSYILADDCALPESLYSSEKLYSLMKKGVKVSTAQASNSERHLHYQASCSQYEKVIYLCTGSAFTGNYQAAKAWQEKNECLDTFQVIDSGAASGRLAVMALLTARFAETGVEAGEVVSYAKELSRRTEEYVFIDELKYLVAGGRTSKTKGFFGELLNMKPVISPGFDGVRKIGVVRNRTSQVAFALEKLKQYKSDSTNLVVLLQYSDNREWLSEVVEPAVRSLLPDAEILLVPLSLTSGVHMGPGTWSVAYDRS